MKRFFEAALLVALATGCGADPAAGNNQDSGMPAGVVTGLDGLNCEVSAVLVRRCGACHGPTPAAGVPMSLASRNDLLAQSLGDPLRNQLQRSILRMQDTVTPIPPQPNAPATADEVAVLVKWMNAGMPAETCLNGDAGVPEVSDGGLAPTTCTTGTYWTLGNRQSVLMNPGMACISCHLQLEGRAILTVGGTIYKGFHEKDTCNGGAGPGNGAVVQLIGADGAVFNLTPNGAGNFWSQLAIKKPYTARVIANGQIRSMIAAQTSGDCNSCHTEQGANGAPGRIVWP